MEARSLSRHIADGFMASFAPHSRLSSNYNTLHDTLRRSLTPSVYQANMFTPLDGQYVTFGVAVIDTGEVTRTLEAAQLRDKKPESGIHQNYTAAVEFKLVFHTLTASEPLGPLTPLGLHADSSYAGDKPIRLPVAHGCMYSISDGDGVGGLFLKNGREHYFSQTLVDCPNHMLCMRYPNGVHRIVCVSRPLNEVSVSRDVKFASSIQVVQLAIVPNEGVYIQTSMGNQLVTEVERSNGDNRVAAFVPLIVYIDMLRWKIEGASAPATTARDVDALFDGIAEMADTMVDTADRDEFCAMVANTKSATLGHMAPRCTGGELEQLAYECFPWLKREAGGAPATARSGKRSTVRESDADKALRLALLRAQAIRDCVPHIAGCATFGRFADDAYGETKFGFFKRMVAHGFATLAGLLAPHDQGDLRGQRIKTAEMEVAMRARSIVQKFVHETLIKPLAEREANKRAWLETHAKKEIAKWKNSELFIKKIMCTGTASHFELATDTRKCFPNMLQKMFMIKITQTASSDPAKRKMHWTYAGHLCGADTPSTADVGLELSPNVSTMVTHDVNPQYVLSKISPLFCPPSEVSCPVFLNGIHVGACRDATRMRDFVRTDIRRERHDEPQRAPTEPHRSHFPLLTVGVNTEPMLILNVSSRVYEWRHCVRIRCDAGRLYKPSINIARVTPEASTKAFYTLIDEGVVEFMDLDEELSHDVRYCASLWEADPLVHTHCELHPTLMHGVLTSLIPHVNRNHGVKNSNMCNHFKAIMHTYSLTHATRVETLSHMAWNLHMPLMRTPAFDWLEMNHRPHGANVLLMIATHCGYNQEDAIVVKRSFVERGGFYGTVSKTFDARDGLGSVKGRRTRIPVGGRFEAGTPLASYAATGNGGAAGGGGERDVRAGLQDHGRVDFVLNNDARFAVRTYRSEIPRVGDKFASSHAQKGTIGQIISEMELPYTEDGLTPDILLNPHAIPSRTTTAQIVELLFGTLAAASGVPMREFAFDETPLETIEALLEQAGVRNRGLVSLIDPISGTRIKAKVYMGIGYYCRLKHIVNDKVRSQDILGGERCAMTKQPASGRKKNGGVRLSEMERWALMAHGGSNTIHDCFTHLSDGTTLTVNGHTGASADVPGEATPGLRSVESNYTVQKLQHTLQAAMIGMSFGTTDA